MGLKIVNATNADVLVLINLESQLFSPHHYRYLNLRSMINNFDYQIKLCYQDQLLIGYYIILINIDAVEIIRIGVLKQYQHKGFGSLIMSDLINTAFTILNRDQIWLEANNYNFVALQLYRKFKFAEQGIRRGYYPNGDATLFTLKRNQN